MMKILIVFWYFWIVILKNVDISFDVCKKCSVTWMSLLKNIHISCVFLILLKCDFQKYWYFVWRMQKRLRHTDGIIENNTHISHVFWYFWNAMLQKRCNSLGFWWWFSVAATSAYEIPPRLCSPLKPTRTLKLKLLSGKKWSIWRLSGLRAVRKHSKRFRDLPGSGCIQTAPNCSWLRVWIWKMEKTLDFAGFMENCAWNYSKTMHIPYVFWYFWILHFRK